MYMAIVSPSLLAADFGNLQRELEMINESEADMLHLDIMDGVFVPNITFGLPILEMIRKHLKKPMDVHLMIVQPEKFIEHSKDLGIEMMTVHYEACVHIHRTLQDIHNAGMKAGVALNPGTPICLLRDIIQDVDVVMVMSVNPGAGGQKFIMHSLDKVRELKKLIEETGSNALIEIDGGVNDKTGPMLIEAGADVLVAGSYVFGAKDPKAVISELKKL
ncbi:MAG: ribulose-phosphate 3-epimerase [Bacteroidales bacterium]|nr:ribulose-phosphate 3-epimerase [Bacteroidales bacterium]